MSDPVEILSEAAKMSVLQGRFEALHQGAALVEPVHMVLGVLRTLSPADRAALATDGAALDQLCVALGASTTSAPLSYNDIDYAASCHALVSAAMAAAGEGAPVDPLHLLLGAHQSASPDVASALASHALSPARIAEALQRGERGSS